jgi:hypothetical protein
MQQENIRPTAITVVCIIGFVFAGLGLLGSLVLLALAPVVGVTVIASIAVSLLAIIWIWQMKKMGVYLYAGMTALGLVLNLSQGNFGILGLIFPAIVLGICFTNINKMS